MDTISPDVHESLQSHEIFVIVQCSTCRRRISSFVELQPGESGTYFNCPNCAAEIHLRPYSMTGVA